MTNEAFTSQLLAPTLEKAERVADTSELFVRSAKLLELSGLAEKGIGNLPSHDSSGSSDRQPGQIQPSVRSLENTGNSRSHSSAGYSDRQSGQIQPLVRSLMKTLLEDFPGLLSERSRQNLMDANYCRYGLDLQLNGLALLRLREEGRMIGNRYRYWKKVYAARYYVTNNWWKQHHCHNAGSLLRFVDGRIDSRAGRPGEEELEKHRMVFRNHLWRSC